MNAVTHRRGFTLTELLVAVAIILMLMSLLSVGVASVRASQKTTATQDAIRKLDDIIMRQFRTYDSRFVNPTLLSSASVNPPPVVFKSPVEKRAWYLRRNVLSGDLPDRWSDVSFMATASGTAIKKWEPTPSQRSYINIWNVATPKPSDTFAGAECLFMIVMQSGMVDPSELRNLPSIGNKDRDEDDAQEFLDAWGNPIGFILWPYAVEVPGGSGRRFFSGSRTPASIYVEDIDGDGVIDSKLSELDRNGNGVVDYPSATLGMRPLIYSAGPDGEYGLQRNNETGNLALTPGDSGASCGDWSIAPTSTSAAPLSGFANDNITNFDSEALR